MGIILIFNYHDKKFKKAIARKTFGNQEGYSDEKTKIS